jgi:hypothetical protein
VPLLLSAAGCTIVNIDGGQAKMHAGSLHIMAPENAEVVAIQSRGFGLIRGARNVTLGYQDERLVYQIAGSSCAIILFDARLDEEGRRFWRELAQTHKDICIKK